MVKRDILTKETSNLCKENLLAGKEICGSFRGLWEAAAERKALYDKRTTGNADHSVGAADVLHSKDNSE